MNRHNFTERENKIGSTCLLYEPVGHLEGDSDKAYKARGTKVEKEMSNFSGCINSK